jgi:hydrolethalus syndrome protein 1
MATRVEVSKEYVREQLHSMGVRDLSEKDLEAYTKDFAELIQHHLREETPAEASGGDSFSSTNSSQLPSEQESFREQALPNQKLSYPRPSAIFKSFPGDKENRVYPLPASATPSPLRPATAPHTTTTTTAGHPVDPRKRGPPVVRKRKILRKVNGESRVFEESYTSVEASPSVQSVASDLTELSLTSATSSDSGSSSSEGHREPHRPQCKSFIRPPTAQLYTRRIKKHDPVARYHYWKEVWENEKFPGVENRNALRWRIREKMAQQDLPFFVPPRRPVTTNKYTVPTDKKRTSLRWEIRHQMAEQL